MTLNKKFSAVLASTALVFTGFSPALAAPVQAPATATGPIDVSSLGWSAEADKAEGWRGNTGYPGYRGYRGYRGHRRHRGRIRGGDVLAGILILGGIAAVASAASNNKRNNDRYRDRDYRNDDRRYDNRRNENRREEYRNDRRSDNRGDRGTGSMDQAINSCSDAAERKAGRDARVSEIRSVTKDGSGWRVEGNLSNSAEPSFLCGSTSGRVDFVQLGAGDLAFAN